MPERISFYRRINEFLHFGKSDDLIKLLSDFTLCHSEYRAVEEDIFASGELWVKASAYFKKASDASAKKYSHLELAP